MCHAGLQENARRFEQRRRTSDEPWPLRFFSHACCWRPEVRTTLSRWGWLGNRFTHSELLVARGGSRSKATSALEKAALQGCRTTRVRFRSKKKTKLRFMVSRHTGPLDTRDKAYLLVLRDPNLCPGPELLLGGFSSGLCGGSHSERQAEEEASGRASPGSEAKAAGGAAEAPSNPEWSTQRWVETPHRHFTLKVLCVISLRSTENHADQFKVL